MDAAVKIKNVSVRLNRKNILKGISADLQRGHIIGLLGPSGAGKTTLIRSIVGRQRISSGQLSVFDLPAGSAALRKRVGYMPQPASIYPDLTVTENLRYFAAMAGHGKKEAHKVIIEVDLTEQADSLVSDLSGGQKSRVSLAAALIGEPPLLVLDEPTVGVDPLLRIRFWQLFKDLAAQGTTLLITSHVMDEAEHCQSLLLIRRGKLLADGSPQELRHLTHTHDIEDSFINLVERGR